MSTWTEAQIQETLKRIQRVLDERREATGYALEVPENGYRQDDGWLYVIVALAQADVRAYDYVEALEDAEKVLRDSGIENVLLVPALAD